MVRDYFRSPRIQPASVSARMLGIVLVADRWAYSQSLIQQIGWKAADPLAIVALLLLLVVSAGILISVHVRRRRRQQINERELAHDIFHSTVVRLKLTELETQKITDILRLVSVLHPHTIFQSFSLFEQCMDAEVRRLLSEYLSDDEREIEEVLLSGLRRKLGFGYLPLEHPLISTRNIAIGQGGSVFGGNHRLPIVQRSTVVANQEFSFKVQYDPEREDVPPIAPGTKLKLAFARQNDGVYGIILDVVGSDSAGIIEFGHTLDLRRNQLRQFVRVEASLPLKFRLLKASDPDRSEVKKQESVDCKMLDISGGGLSFLCERALRPGDLVSLTFALPSASLAGIAGKVVRIGLQEGKSILYYRHHIQFAGIETARREQIVKYVFERQRQVNQWR